MESVMRLVLASLFVSAAASLPTASLAHEFWIEPQEYQVESGSEITAHLVNGQNFSGTKLSYFDTRITTFNHTFDGQTAPYEGRNGDSPALTLADQPDGLHVLAYVSSVSRVNYAEWAKFQGFADHKDFADMRARHDARGLPATDFWEAYTRFAKSLVGVGSAAGTDQNLGLETEIVALENPYTGDMSDGIDVQVFYQGNARAETQVELFDKPAEGEVVITLHRTNAEGIVTLPVTPGHSYLVDAVVLRIPSDALAKDKDAVWETLWAALTFAVPATP
jgi:uncharacterized GH25 family protein